MFVACSTAYISLTQSKTLLRTSDRPEATTSRSGENLSPIDANLLTVLSRDVSKVLVTEDALGEALSVQDLEILVFPSL